MALSVLYIGGTGQISLPCVEASLTAGHDVTILNRNKTVVDLPKGVKTLVGDMTAAAYGELGDKRFDVVAQFRLYTPDQMKRDIATFTGKTGQYVFISSASALREASPSLHDERADEAREQILAVQPRQDRLRAIAARSGQARLHHRASEPYGSHRDADPGRRPRFGAIRRMIAGKPVIVAGDGSYLWTLTRSVDVATPFVRLLGNSAALNDDFHITTDRGFTWNQIHEAIARGFGVEAIHAHVPTETLVRFNKEWVGPLLGDKTWSALFDNSKVQACRGRLRGLAGYRRDPSRLDRPCKRAAESASAARIRRGSPDRQNHRGAKRPQALRPEDWCVERRRFTAHSDTDTNLPGVTPRSWTAEGFTGSLPLGLGARTPAALRLWRL